MINPQIIYSNTIDTSHNNLVLGPTVNGNFFQVTSKTRC